MPTVLCVSLLQKKFSEQTFFHMFMIKSWAPKAVFNIINTYLVTKWDHPSKGDRQ
jgi:hypothetical protein